MIIKMEDYKKKKTTVQTLEEILERSFKEKWEEYLNKKK